MDPVPRIRGQAFGLTLDVRFDCPGLPLAGPGHADGPVVELELTDDDLAAAFPAGADRLWQLRGPGGDLEGHFDSDPTTGYLLTAAGYGSFVIDRTATRVRCAPTAEPAWRWQRFLVGQVLPFVAVLHGFEVFHSSMVGTGDSAVAFLGVSRAGKSSLAVASVLRGARYVTDDVATIEATDDGVRAHPGFGLTSVRLDLAEQLTAAELERLGHPIGADEEALRLAVEVIDRPVTLASAYFLERGADGDACSIAACDDVAPRLLLSSSYNFVLRDRERLTRQLDTCARIARTVPLFRLSIPPGASPFDAAAMVADHEATLAGAR